MVQFNLHTTHLLTPTSRHSHSKSSGQFYNVKVTNFFYHYLNQISFSACFKETNTGLKKIVSYTL